MTPLRAWSQTVARDETGEAMSVRPEERKVEDGTTEDVLLETKEGQHL